MNKIAEKETTSEQKIISLYSFFKSERDRNFIEQAFNYAKTNLHKQAKPLPLFKRIEKTMVKINTELIEEINIHYIDPHLLIGSPYENMNYQYLRLIHQSVKNLKLERLYDKILYIEFPDTKITLKVHPIMRFLYPFKGYIGSYFSDITNYSANGLHKDNLQLIYGIREIEKIIISNINEGDSFNAKFLELIDIYLNRYNKNDFEKKDTILLAIIKSQLPDHLKQEALEYIHIKNNLLDLTDENLSDVIKEEINNKISKKFKTKENEIIKELNEDELISTLQELYPGEEDSRMVRKLAKIMKKVRKGTYSVRCKPPEGYVAVMCRSILDGHFIQMEVLPGQEPFEVKLVRASREIREIHSIGTFFVCWISKSQIENKEEKSSYYISYANTLLPIFFNY
jgi:hypothetical protein